jgi:two-component system sensor histidine kinase AlgZ
VNRQSQERAQEASTPPAGSRDDSFFLPDFCALPVTFAVVVFSELFALIVTLAPLSPRGNFWTDLALASLFMQWVALTGAAGLCYLSPHLRHLSVRAASVIAWLLLVLLVALFSQLTLQIAVYAALDLPHAFVLRNIAIGAIVSAILLRYFYVQHQYEHRVRAESEARVQALQARIRPHFLFNSMNTIASLIRGRPEVAETAVEDLSDLFRASLSDGRKLIPLDEEFDLCRRYLHMEGLRLGDRLRVRWAVEGLPADALVPPLTLQPLLENAVYHGIEPLAEGGELSIDLSVADERIVVRIENPVGSAPEGAGPIAHAGNRMALDNIRQRLALHYDLEADLASQSGDGRYRVTIRLPIRRPERVPGHQPPATGDPQ